MSSLSKAALLLVVTAVVAFGGWSPGRVELQYDNEANTPLIKVGYPSNGTGFGVQFNPWNGSDARERWTQLCTVKVRLCPPPVDGAQERIYILPPKPDGTPDMANPLWISDPFDVRIGEWWHTIPITKPGGLWIPYSLKPFVFSLATSAYNTLFQFFDGTKNAPAGTQWWYNGSTFSLVNNPNVGDIMIRLVIQKHDFTAVGFVAPQQGDFYPEGIYKNATGFAETNVPIKIVIKTDPDGVIVYEDSKVIAFPAEEFPNNRSEFFRRVVLPEGDYQVWSYMQYHGSAGDGYPVRYDRDTQNDLFRAFFSIVSTKGKSTAPKARTE